MRRVVVFLRDPALGAVKTRLGRGIGRARATAFYRRVASDTIRRLDADRRWRLVLSVTPDGAYGPWPRRIPRCGQGTGDIGARMARTLRRARHTVLVGSDIPCLRPRHIMRAFRLLAVNRVVFGPAEDGGFWLVGVKRPTRLFAGPVRWSHPATRADAMAASPGPAGLCDMLGDVDDAEAWFAYTRSRCATRSSP